MTKREGSTEAQMEPTHRSFAIFRRERHERVNAPWSISVMTISTLMSLSIGTQRNAFKSTFFMVTITIAILALLLIVANATIHFSSPVSQRERGLKASVVETLDYHRENSQHGDEPEIPFDRGVPNLTVR